MDRCLGPGLEVAGRTRVVFDPSLSPRFLSDQLRVGETTGDLRNVRPVTIQEPWRIGDLAITWVDDNAGYVVKVEPARGNLA